MSITTEGPTNTPVRPFSIDVPEAELEDLRQRVAAHAGPTVRPRATHPQGIQLARVQQLRRLLGH